MLPISRKHVQHAGPFKGKNSCSTGDGRAKSAAGAVTAAVRELRPLEIVGLYEAQREALEVLHATFWSHY